MRASVSRLLSSQLVHPRPLLAASSAARQQSLRLSRRLYTPVRYQPIGPSAYINKPLRSSVDPVLVLIAVTVTSVSGYIISEYFYPPEKQQEEPQELEAPAILDDNGDMVLDQPGRPGNLTAEQELRLKELWVALFEVFGSLDSETASHTVSRASSISSFQKTGSGTETPKSEKKKSRMSWLKGGKNSPEPGNNDAVNDKYGSSTEFKKILASQSKEELRKSFWDNLKQDDPDGVMLRFLRARKWNVHDALVMMVNAFQWRNNEMKVDNDIMRVGEEGFLKRSQTGEGTAKKDAADFTAQLHMGKSILHGVDKENRPITIVRARLHNPGKESDASLERYTIYVIETARLMLRPPVDTATIIFDMTGFGLSNMDYAPVKFMIKCFEANYPESLGAILVYKAPWIFSGIWKIIKGWLDPVVASKIHFCSGESELEQYIDRKHMLKELGGDYDWEYKYQPPVEGENERMKDTETRDKLVAERRAIADEYDALTLAWARDNDADAAKKRVDLVKKFQDNHWKLDPYVRARSLWDRTGVLGEAGKLDFYPDETKATAVDAMVNKARGSNTLGVAGDADGESVYHDARSHLGDLD